MSKLLEKGQENMLLSPLLMENYRNWVRYATVASSNFWEKRICNNAQKRFVCPTCSKSYKNKRHLYRHQKEECIGVEPRFRCDICFKLFRRKYHLSRHVANKHEVKTECKEDVQRLNLLVTKFLHVVEDYDSYIKKLSAPQLLQKFQCLKCQKVYKHKHILKRHLKYECGKEPQFQCTICGHKNKRRYELSIHIKTKHLLT
ncbi:hypothetical protein NQ315_001107 [Exocentrus adspersus]|uniref:C2H2-type domain-containing protein n=1 Tax=Exocentrus adspersus TaxID=1586481 RepID=A0AAV8WEI8_9CUCU|nr:hypothetical protein NQ315_001107 [Exocentrus adspersus]